MLKLVPTPIFRKEYALMKKHGAKMHLLDAVLETLQNERPLPVKHRDHALVGTFVGYRECHILPDWLLIYKVVKDELLLVAARTGSHSDLFSN